MVGGSGAEVLGTRTLFAALDHPVQDDAADFGIVRRADAKEGAGRDVDLVGAARDLLQGLGQPLEWHDYPMEHSVCIEEVQALQQWLLRVLAAD